MHDLGCGQAGCHTDSVANQCLIGSNNLMEQIFFRSEHELFLFCVKSNFFFFFSFDFIDHQIMCWRWV